MAAGLKLMDFKANKEIAVNYKIRLKTVFGICCVNVQPVAILFSHHTMHREIDFYSYVCS